MHNQLNKKVLDCLYDKYNHREFVHPDPLEFLYHYDNLADREIVGLVASSLAYGRVAHILKSISGILSQMVPSPSIFLQKSSRKSLCQKFANFKHRFTTGQDIANLLLGIIYVIEQYGSLYVFFKSNLKNEDDTILPALASFVKELNRKQSSNFLLPSPKDGSACKRLNLFLRWMVRCDKVDPGGWDAVPPSKLIVPIDTHMYKICYTFNLTKRKQADIKTAVEITNAFRTIAPNDPVRYDFVLTRTGIRNDIDLNAFLEQYNIIIPLI